MDQPKEANCQESTINTQAVFLCDKCGMPVSHQNSLLELLIAIGGPGAIFVLNNRHLLPVVKDGQIMCEGSPSNAQYIEGQPRDTRGYTYDLENESVVREAYKRVQKKFATQM